MAWKVYSAAGLLKVTDPVVPASGITGTLALSHGGTGQIAQTAAMDALSPTSAKGDLLIDNGTSVAALAVGSNGKVLTANSAATNGADWETPSSNSLLDLFLYGDGGDGDVTISGPTTLTRDMYYHNLTVSSGAAITTAGFKIYISGTLDITAAPAGWLKNNGNAASTITIGAALASQTIGGSAAGGVGSGTVSTVGGVGVSGDAGGIGGNGGRSGSSASTAGASTVTGISIRRIAQELIKGASNLIGGSGGTAGTNGASAAVQSGAGGGGAGVIYLAAATISRGGSTTANGIQANGGNGGSAITSGSGSGAGGGGGGGGGWIYLIYKTLTGSTATNLISAGGGGGGGGGNAVTTGGSGGSGGSGGRITIIDSANNILTETSGGTGTGGSANTGATGGGGGGGATLQASL